MFRSWGQLEDFNWERLVTDNIEYGEPGIINLPLIWQTDPGATGINPCFSGDTLIAVADGRNAVSIQQLAEEGLDVPVYSMNKATGKVEIKMGRNPRVTGYAKKLVRVWLDDGGYLDTTPDHKFVLRDGSVVVASELESGMSLPRFTKALERVKKGSKDYYLVHCNTLDYHDSRVFEHRLIARFHDPERWKEVYSTCRQNGFANTGGLVVHHKDYDQLNNSPENLQIMTFREHARLHGEIDQTGEKNGRWSGLSNGDIREHALGLTRKLGRRFSRKEWREHAKELGLPQRFSEFRSNSLGSILTLAKSCALELGFEAVGEDPRVVRTYQSMLEQGYDARLKDGRVLVPKVCEGCGASFEVSHEHREYSFCSNACGTLYLNSDPSVKARRVAGTDKTHSARMKDTKLKQAKAFSDLKFSLGRPPNRKEWSFFCKSEGLPFRIGPTLKFGFRSFEEVAEAGNSYNHKVARVEELSGEHTVYNITVDDFHTVATVTSTRSKGGSLSYIGVYVANCGEVPLADREACNLAEVFPAKFKPSTDPRSVFRLVTRYCLRQRLQTLLDPESDAIQRKNMRVGVGLGGICDFEWTPDLLADWYGYVRYEADNYADGLRVNRPIAVTTTKPSGTTSLLNGSSPGIHAPHAPYYIRRTRIAKNDPMSEAMMEAGVPFEEDCYDKTRRTWVFSFPAKAQNSRVTSKNETLRGQFERQAAIQEWWSDNAVSATLNFDPETEREELASCLREFVPRLKSTSCLPRSHGYAQPPYESCTRLEYEEMYGQIKHDSLLVRGGDMEVEECSSGACPIR
jgi:ribonucleotide reductase alpha subunit